VSSTEAAPPIYALVIDDEPQIQRLLTITLEDNGYRVTTTGTGREGLAAAAERRHDVIILDLALPDLRGVSVLKQIREWSQTPVVILSVQNAESDMVEALDGGADDYVTKPFRTAELLARLRAALRRSAKGESGELVLHFGALTIDLVARRVMRDNELVKLTGTEYALLKLFAQNAGRVLTHHYILCEVWGPAQETQVAYLRTYIKRLRKKLEPNPDKPVLLLAEAGVGYRFAER
jgi:two-component system KDP operon response regulator KdpE